MYENAERQGQPWSGGPFGPGGYSPPTGRGGYRTITPDEMRERFGQDDPFSDFFNTFFGRTEGGGAPGQSGARGRSQKGRDIEHEIELTLEEAFHGAARRMSITEGGHARSIDVRIPPGVKDGSRVRASGEGETGANGGASGDLYLRVRVRPHPMFERKGDDLSTQVAVPVETAVLGGEAQVPTVTGAVRLKIPETTQNGQVFRLKGHGMPLLGKPDERGDLYATIDVQLPRSLTREQREHYEAIRESTGDSREAAASSRESAGSRRESGGRSHETSARR
jgi:DnaJ-class molecular chaperone